MKRAVLFWCYKKLALCEDRLRSLRRENPDTSVYVLFGGDVAEAAKYEEALSPYADDFYVFDDPPPPIPESFPKRFRGGVFWKYMWGDLLLASWYRNRGVDLEWDTVIVVQWDMLVFGKIDEVFGCLQKDEILLSGLRPVRDVEDRWVWVAEDFPEDRIRYLQFLEHVRERYGFSGDPKCCIAIVLCLPRCFLEKFAKIELPTLGFLEYRLPIFAEAFGVPFCTDHNFKAWWGTEKYTLRSTLRARPREIWIPTIFANLRRKDGARVFHPYWRKTPTGVLGWTWAYVDAFPRLLFDAVWAAWEQVWVRVRRRLPGTATGANAD